MLEKIMNLHLLLYAMTVLGWLGVLGMLAARELEKSYPLTFLAPRL